MFYEPMNSKVTLPEPLPASKCDLNEVEIEITTYDRFERIQNVSVRPAQEFIKEG